MHHQFIIIIIIIIYPFLLYILLLLYVLFFFQYSPKFVNSIQFRLFSFSLFSTFAPFYFKYSVIKHISFTIFFLTYKYNNQSSFPPPLPLLFRLLLFSTIAFSFLFSLPLNYTSQSPPFAPPFSATSPSRLDSTRPAQIMPAFALKYLCIYIHRL